MLVFLTDHDGSLLDLITIYSDVLVLCLSLLLLDRYFSEYKFFQTGKHGTCAKYSQLGLMLETVTVVKKTLRVERADLVTHHLPSMEPCDLPGACESRALATPVFRRKEDPCLAGAQEGREIDMEWHLNRHPPVSGTQPAMPTPLAGSQGRKDPTFLHYGSTSAGSLRPRLTSDVLEGERVR